MARSNSSKGLQRNAAPDTNHEGDADQFELERKVLFEEVSFSTSTGARKGSRLEAFVETENQRSINGKNIAAVRNIEALSEIIARRCAREQHLEEEPDDFQAQKLRHARLVKCAMPFTLLVCQIASRSLSAEYTARLKLEEPAKILKPYYLDDNEWKRGGARYNTIFRKRLKREYEIGNRKPPKSTQFKGSGNSAGRPNGSSSYARMQAALKAPIKVKTSGGAEVGMDRRELVLRILCRDAIAGDPAARRELMRRLKDLDRLGLLSAPPIHRRLRRVKLSEDQRSRILEVFMMCLARTREDMKIDYDRYFSLRDEASDRGDTWPDDCEAQSEEKPKVPTGIDRNTEEGKTNADRKYPTIPTIQRRRATPSEGPKAAGKHQAPGQKRSANAPKK